MWPSFQHVEYFIPVLFSFQHVEYFIPVLFICKFHKDWFKITQAMLRTQPNMLCFFFHSRASNSRVNSAIWLEFQLVQYFMPVQVTCNFHKDPIKN